MSPGVTVVMPVRDGGAYLAPAVRSILEQDYTDFELLLVDDHSRDGAIESLTGTDRRLRILASSGRGMVAAFNTGLREARGTYVARMDGDDLALPQRLSRQAGLLDEQPELGACGACVEFFPAERVGAGMRRYESWLNGLRSPRDIRLALFVESPIPNPTAMFRTHTLRALGGYRETEWPEDYDLFLRADAAGVRMAKPEGVLLRWREHGDRLTHRHPRYTLDQFQRAKARYLAAGRLPARPLVIWGAGPTGRTLCDRLAEQGVQVEAFLEVHPRRIGGRKRGLPVYPIERALDPGVFVLVAVGARGARARIRDWLEERGRGEGDDFLFTA